MNDQTPLRFDAMQKDERFTPAGLQELSTLTRRRIIMAALVLVTISGLAYILARVLGSNGWTPLDIGIFIAFLISTPWTVMGFWNAIIGFWLLHGARDPMGKVAPFMHRPATGPLMLRTAILMTLRNEDPARAYARLRILRESLERTGEVGKFDFFVLSDTDDDEVAEAEEKLFAIWQGEFADQGRTFYRRRQRNEGFKAGNVRDFLVRWGDGYDLMLPLDADSLMSGAEIVRMVRLMQGHARIGILQSLVTGTPSTSAFARLFQFGMRHGMRSYTIGNAWWNGDCGPYWGHNAVVRVAPFKAACDLPVLPGKPPLGGYVLSHDQIEATLMRAAGFEVRVIPVEGESWEDNPPTILDYTKRDLRWCQGNMQYWKLVGLPGLLPFSRFQILMGIFMYLAAFAWIMMISLFALKVFETEPAWTEIHFGVMLFICSFVIAMMPKITGMLDVVFTPGGMARYGGGLRFLGSSLAEIVFSMMLAPISALRVSIFMVSLCFGRSVIWSGQQRDVRGLSWATAIAGMWPQTLFGITVTGLLFWGAPGALIWGAPLLVPLILSAPFAVVTASPAFGRFLTRIGLCAIPEERQAPLEIRKLAGADMQRTDAEMPGGQFSPMPSN